MTVPLPRNQRRAIECDVRPLCRTNISFRLQLVSTMGWVLTDHTGDAASGEKDEQEEQGWGASNTGKGANRGSFVHPGARSVLASVSLN